MNESVSSPMEPVTDEFLVYRRPRAWGRNEVRDPFASITDRPPPTRPLRGARERGEEG